MRRNILKSIIAILFLTLSLILLKNIYDLDILPNNYLITLSSIVIFINIIADVLLFIKGKVSKVFSVFIYLILTAISFIGIKYTSNTIDFLNKSFNNHIMEVTSYSVLVKSNSKINNINGLNNDYKMYYLNSDSNNKLVSEKIKEKSNVNLIGIDDIYIMYEDLIKGNISSIVIETSYLDVISEDYKVEKETKTIYTFELEHEKREASKEIKELRPMNILVSGSDSRADTIYNKSRSDVNMILTINPNTHTILMTSIPRDYYVSVYGKPGLKDKLTHSGIYGLDVTKKTLEDFFDIKIDYAIKVNFNSVVKLVDLVNGIDVYSDTEFDSSHYPGWRVPKGTVHMDGAHALAYARERYAYKSGDNHRIMNQQQVLEATLQKVISDKSMLLKYDKLLDSFKNFYVTDIPKSVVTLFVKDQLKDMKKWNFESQKVTGTGLMTNTYTGPTLKRWVMIPNEESVKSATKKIKETLK